MGKCGRSRESTFEEVDERYQEGSQKKELMTITITEVKNREEKKGRRNKKAMKSTSINAPIVFCDLDLRTAKSHKK